MKSPPRIVIADDHLILVNALAQLLQRELDIEIAAQATNAQEAVQACAAHQPDLLLLDIEMPGRDALGAIMDVHGVSPRTRIVILSAFCRDSLISMALRADVYGFLVKTESPKAIIAGVQAVLRGERVYSESVRNRLVPDPSGPGRRTIPQCRLDALTLREAEVLRYIGKGLTNDEMATAMHLSKRTVERHVARLMDTVGIRERSGLTRLAFESGVAV